MTDAGKRKNPPVAGGAPIRESAPIQVEFIQAATASARVREDVLVR